MAGAAAWAEVTTKAARTAAISRRMALPFIIMGRC
jgi:hypothetical protein